MEFGAVFPHNEIGTDPGAIKAYAQGVEALGATHLLIYDHVLGADPDHAGGWQGAYDKRFRLGIGTGWNKIEYEALNETFTNRGKRQAEQVELMRKLWREDSLTYQSEYHTINGASIKPRPSKATPTVGLHTQSKWRDIGATHLAIATHNAGPTDVDGHLSRIQEYLYAVNS